MIQRFGTAHGLPGLNEDFVYPIGGRALFATRRGLFRFDESRGRFEPDPRFAKLFPAGPRWIYTIREDPQGRLWMGSSDEASGVQEAGAAIPEPGDSYRWDPRPLQHFAGTWTESVHVDEDGVVWFGADEGLFRYDPRVAKDHDTSFTTLIRKVSLQRGGAPIHGGAGQPVAPVLDYADNAVRFEYAAPSFDGAEALRFQVLLEGNDRDWSPWTAEGHREYTNLREGAYRFRVRARNLHGTVSSEGVYAFRVRPPLSRTPWAYVAYVLAAGGLAWGLVRWRVRLVQAEKRVLEGTVAARTRELSAKNDQLEAAKARAEEASRAKSVFLANMSHELRTPLNGVLGFAQLMDRDAQRSPQDRRHLATIKRCGEHLLGLINDVLSLSKIEAGGVSLSPAPLDLGALLDGVCELVRLRAETHQLWLRTEWSGLPKVVLGDAGKLHQILLNLVGNAVKFTEQGGVTLRARWEGGRGTFEVEDTGPGIAADEVGLLFAPFVQTETGRQSKEGTGLGLALSRQLARLMGGDITVRSEWGRGSTFRLEVSLPAAAEDEVPAERGVRRPVRALAPGQPAYRMLVVDDIPDNRTLLSSLLAAVGFEVQEAADGEEALLRWREWQPHFVWMDKRMPGMDGLEATRRIRDEERRAGTPRVPIVVLSASALEHEREEILSCGCDDFVAKPFRDGLIFAKVAEHLGVRYLHEPPQPAESANAAASAVSAERLARLPEAWLAAMQSALTSGDARTAHALADQLDASDAGLAAQIRGLLDGYRLDEVEGLLGVAAAANPGRPSPNEA